MPTFFRDTAKSKVGVGVTSRLCNLTCVHVHAPYCRLNGDEREHSTGSENYAVSIGGLHVPLLHSQRDLKRLDLQASLVLQ